MPDVKIKVELTHEDLVVLTRAMNRAADETPKKEMDAFNDVRIRIGEWWAQTLPPGQLRAVSEAMDRHIGR